MNSASNLNFIGLLRLIEENCLDVFSTSELAGIADLPAAGIQNYLETLANNGLIYRLEKGKYCRIYITDKYVIASHLVKDGVISHQSALEYHGFGTRSGNQVFVSSCSQKQSKTIRGNRINFIRIKPHKAFGADTVQNENSSFRVTDLEKTLLDCFDLPRYVNSYKHFVQTMVQTTFREDKLLNYGLKMQNFSILKRIAFLLDNHSNKEHVWLKEEVARRMNTRYTLLDPGGSDTGPFCPRWRIRNNMVHKLLSI